MLLNKSGNISETRKDRGKVTMDWTAILLAYRNSSTLFRSVYIPSPTPYGLTSPRLGVRNRHKKLQSKMAGKRYARYAVIGCKLKKMLMKAATVVQVLQDLF